MVDHWILHYYELKMFLQYKIITFLIAFYNIEAKSDRRKIVLNWDDLTTCSDFDNKVTDLSRIDIFMVNETLIGVKGELDIKEDLDTRPMTVKAFVEREVGQSYMVILNHEVEDICFKIEDEEDDWNGYFKSFDPPLNKCPISKGIYKVMNLEPQKVDVQYSKDVVGKYRCRLELFRKKGAVTDKPEMWACYMLKFILKAVK